MIYGSLDSFHQDESNGSKIIQIGAIFVEIAIFSKISGRVGSGQLYDPTRNFGRVGSGTRPELTLFGANTENFFCFSPIHFSRPYGMHLGDKRFRNENRKKNFLLVMAKR